MILWGIVGVAVIALAIALFSVISSDEPSGDGGPTGGTQETAQVGEVGVVTGFEVPGAVWDTAAGEFIETPPVAHVELESGAEVEAALPEQFVSQVAEGDRVQVKFQEGTETWEVIELLAE